MNFVKKSLVEETKGGVGALEGVRALLLPTSDLSTGPWGPASSSCSSMKLVKGLLQGLCQA